MHLFGVLNTSCKLALTLTLTLTLTLNIISTPISGTLGTLEGNISESMLDIGTYLKNSPNTSSFSFIFSQCVAAISKDVEREVTENAGTAFQESSGPDVKKGCETVTLLKTSEGFEAPLDPGSNAIKEKADKIGRESKESDNNTPSEEPEGDGQINNDHREGSDESDENESDIEVIITRVAKNNGQ